MENVTLKNNTAYQGGGIAMTNSYTFSFNNLILEKNKGIL